MPFSCTGRTPDAARVLIGLTAGIGIGLAIAGTVRPTLLLAVTASETIGTLWVNAIRMTVVPLVAALLISRIAGTSGSAGRVGAKAFALFLLLALASAVFAAIVAPPLVSALPLDPDTLEGIRATAVAPTNDIAPFRDWLTTLVTPNPLKAAADGALLPFVVFTVCFALALNRTDERSRVTIVRFFEAITRTMFVLIGWIIRLSPLGVFALGLSLAARGGVGVASALVLYVLAVAVLLATATDRKSTRLNSSHLGISYAVFCLKKKKHQHNIAVLTVQPTIITNAAGIRAHGAQAAHRDGGQIEPCPNNAGEITLVKQTADTASQ